MPCIMNIFSHYPIFFLSQFCTSLYVCECFTCMYICVPRECNDTEAVRCHWIPQRWRYRGLEPSHRCCEAKSDSLPKQLVLLASEPSFISLLSHISYIVFFLWSSSYFHVYLATAMVCLWFHRPCKARKQHVHLLLLTLFPRFPAWSWPVKEV